MSGLRKRFPDLVLLWIVGGFGILTLELLLTGHTKGTQLLGVFASAAGALLALLALLVPRLRAGWLVGFLVVGFFGIVGVAEHAEGDESDGAAFAVARYDDEEGEGGEGEEAAPPPLAPLGLTGLAALGGLALFAREEGAEEAG